MIKSQAELRKFLALCRKQGVKEIKFGDLSVVFGDLPQKRAGDVEDTDEEPETDGLSPEDLAFYSVGGVQHP